MNILILAPTGSERQYFEDILESHKNAGIVTKHNYDLIQLGIGKVNVAVNLTSYLRLNPEKHFDLAVVVGFAAASSKFNQGDLISPTKVKFYDVNVPEVFDGLNREYELVGEDPITVLSGDSFITSDMAKTLIESYGQDVIFDMEIGAVCQSLDMLREQIPVRVVKIISDIPELDEHNLATYLEYTDLNGDFSSIITYIENHVD